MFQFDPKTAQTNAKPDIDRTKTVRGTLLDFLAAASLITCAILAVLLAVSAYLLGGRALLRWITG
jgi:hypothetical protein